MKVDCWTNPIILPAVCGHQSYQIQLRGTKNIKETGEDMNTVLSRDPVARSCQKIK